MEKGQAEAETTAKVRGHWLVQKQFCSGVAGKEDRREALEQGFEG